MPFGVRPFEVGLLPLLLVPLAWLGDIGGSSGPCRRHKATVATEFILWSGSVKDLISDRYSATE